MTTLDRPQDRAAWVGCDQGALCQCEYTPSTSLDAEDFTTAPAPTIDGEEVVLICLGCDLDLH